MSLDVKIKHQVGSFSLDVSFSQSDKGVTALFGPSGSGKSLTTDIIAGLTRPQRGEIKVNDNFLFSSINNINVPTHKRKIGYVFQDARLFPHLTVIKNLLFGANRRATAPEQPTIDHIVNLLDIGKLLNRYPTSLSGGEKQRVAIGRALLSQPDILLLDEPTAALDSDRKEEIYLHLERVKAESPMPILLITHSMKEVSRLSDQVVLIDNGKIEGQGPVETITSSLELRGSYSNLGWATTIFGDVVGHTEFFTEVKISDAIFLVPLCSNPVGSRLRLRIFSRDVMLSKSNPTEISANNIFLVRVVDFRFEANGSVDVRLCLGEDYFLASLTRFSWDRLGLGIGCEVYAIVKSLQLGRVRFDL